MKRNDSPLGTSEMVWPTSLTCVSSIKSASCGVTPVLQHGYKKVGTSGLTRRSILFHSATQRVRLSTHRSILFHSVTQSASVKAPQHPFPLCHSESASDKARSIHFHSATQRMPVTKNPLSCATAIADNNKGTYRGYTCRVQDNHSHSPISYLRKT